MSVAYLKLDGILGEGSGDQRDWIPVESWSRGTPRQPLRGGADQPTAGGSTEIHIVIPANTRAAMEFATASNVGKSLGNGILKMLKTHPSHTEDEEEEKEEQKEQWLEIILTDVYVSAVQFSGNTATVTLSVRQVSISVPSPPPDSYDQPTSAGWHVNRRSKVTNLRPPSATHP